MAATYHLKRRTKAELIKLIVIKDERNDQLDKAVYDMCKERNTFRDECQRLGEELSALRIEHAGCEAHQMHMDPLLDELKAKLSAQETHARQCQSALMIEATINNRNKAQLEELRHEVDAAHYFLDQLSIPRFSNEDLIFSLLGRLRSLFNRTQGFKWKEDQMHEK